MRLAARLLAFLALFVVPLAGSIAETKNGGEAKSEEAKPNENDKGDAKERPFAIVVLGDSLADGLWASLYRGYIRQQKLVSLKRHAVNSAGFNAHSFEDDFEKIAKDPVDLVIFMVGANDRQRAFAIGAPREWAAFRTEKWHQIYRQNIQRFLGLMQEKKVPLVWVGLPIMRKEDASEDAKMMNGIYRELAATHGAVFVDTWAITANKDGDYDPYLEDDKGKKRRFRHDDGVHFTDFGYDHVRKLVLNVAREKLPQLQALWSVPGP